MTSHGLKSRAASLSLGLPPTGVCAHLRGLLRWLGTDPSGRFPETSLGHRMSLMGRLRKFVIAHSQIKLGAIPTNSDASTSSISPSHPLASSSSQTPALQNLRQKGARPL